MPVKPSSKHSLLLLWLLLLLLLIIIIIIIIISRSICKLPIDSEIYKLYIQKLEKASITIIIIIIISISISIIIIKKAFPWGVHHCKRKEEATLEN